MTTFAYDLPAKEHRIDDYEHTDEKEDGVKGSEKWHRIQCNGKNPGEPEG